MLELANLLREDPEKPCFHVSAQWQKLLKMLVAAHSPDTTCRAAGAHLWLD